MTTPAQPEPSVTPLQPREVTAALRSVYPRSIPVRSDASPDGPVFVSLGNPAGRYLGIERDVKVAANLLGWYLGLPVTITGYDYPDAAGCACSPWPRTPTARGLCTRAARWPSPLTPQPVKYSATSPPIGLSQA